MSSEWPAKDSEVVKKWQSDFAAQYPKANTLIATAKTIPGVASNGVCIPPFQSTRIFRRWHRANMAMTIDPFDV